MYSSLNVSHFFQFTCSVTRQRKNERMNFYAAKLCSIYSHLIWIKELFWSFFLGKAELFISIFFLVVFAEVRTDKFLPMKLIIHQQNNTQTENITLIQLWKIIPYLPTCTIMEAYATISDGDDRLVSSLSFLDFCDFSSHQFYFTLQDPESGNPIPLQTTNFCRVFAVPCCNSCYGLISADFFAIC